MLLEPADPFVEVPRRHRAGSADGAVEHANPVHLPSLNAPTSSRM